jgi:phthalate 4,5-dioxygenase reductase subunit
MMDDVQAMTGHWDEGTIHFENFGNHSSDGNPTNSNLKNIAFDIERLSTKQIYRIEEHQTILEGLRQHGFQLASSCESGTCGTCKTSYLAGEVDHRDFVLTPEEQKNQLMICVSRASSPTL